MTFRAADALWLTCHFRRFVYVSIVPLWTAEVHFPSDIPQCEEGEGPDYSKVIPSLPKQVVSPLKSHSLCCSTWSQLSVLESFLSALQNKQLSLMPLSFAPPPRASLPFLSPSVSLFNPVTVAHSQVDGRHQKGWVGGIWDKCVRDTPWYRCRGTSLSEPCLRSYPQPGDNRWCGGKGNPVNHPGAGWRCGEVSV